MVIAAEDQTDRYVVIDGYKRIAALEQLGRTPWKRWCGSAGSQRHVNLVAARRQYRRICLGVAPVRSNLF